MNESKSPSINENQLCLAIEPENNKLKEASPPTPFYFNILFPLTLLNSFQPSLLLYLVLVDNN